MSSEKRENFKGGYKTTRVSRDGTRTEKVYEKAKYTIGSDTLKSKKVTRPK